MKASSPGAVGSMVGYSPGIELSTRVENSPGIGESRHELPAARS